LAHVETVNPDFRCVAGLGGYDWRSASATARVALAGHQPALGDFNLAVDSPDLSLEADGGMDL
jgi:hypothetical protein